MGAQKLKLGPEIETGHALKGLRISKPLPVSDTREQWEKVKGDERKGEAQTAKHSVVSRVFLQILVHVYLLHSVPPSPPPLFVLGEGG